MPTKKTVRGKKTFGQLLKNFRERAGYSLRELAAAIEMHPSVLSRVENGTRRPPNLLKYIVPIGQLLQLDEKDGRQFINLAYKETFGESSIEPYDALVQTITTFGQLQLQPFPQPPPGPPLTPEALRESLERLGTAEGMKEFMDPQISPNKPVFGNVTPAIFLTLIQLFGEIVLDGVSKIVLTKPDGREIIRHFAALEDDVQKCG